MQTSYKNNFLKSKITSYGDEATDFHTRKITGLDPDSLLKQKMYLKQNI